jgi:RluA family pseudouridine synthase
MTPEELLARVLHRDAHMLIIDKPAGLPVHPGPRSKEHLELYLDALRFGLPRPPHLAHRLDRDTSGCLVLGRHPRALRRLGRLFAGGQVEKVYWAICQGTPPEPGGRIDLPIRKLEWKGGWKIVTDPEGQPALTHWRLLAERQGVSLVEFRPRTGRTHQIRVHAAAMGFPVMGDPFYGREPASGGPQQLHARAIALPFTEGKPPVTAVAPLPEHMKRVLEAAGLPLDEVDTLQAWGSVTSTRA